MITVEVASAMQGTDFTKSVTIIAPANPTRQVAQFHFSELSGRAIVTTNIRLADSQEVTAIAEMADGSTRIARKFIQVTVGGCNT